MFLTCRFLRPTSTHLHFSNYGRCLDKVLQISRDYLADSIFIRVRTHSHAEISIRYLLHKSLDDHKIARNSGYGVRLFVLFWMLQEL